MELQNRNADAMHKNDSSNLFTFCDFKYFICLMVVILLFGGTNGEPIDEDPLTVYPKPPRVGEDATIVWYNPPKGERRWEGGPNQEIMEHFKYVDEKYTGKILVEQNDTEYKLIIINATQEYLNAVYTAHIGFKWKTINLADILKKDSSTVVPTTLGVQENVSKDQTTAYDDNNTMLPLEDVINIQVPANVTIIHSNKHSYTDMTVVITMVHPKPNCSMSLDWEQKALHSNEEWIKYNYRYTVSVNFNLYKEKCSRCQAVIQCRVGNTIHKYTYQRDASQTGQTSCALKTGRLVHLILVCVLVATFVYKVNYLSM